MQNLSSLCFFVDHPNFLESVAWLRGSAWKRGYVPRNVTNQKERAGAIQHTGQQTEIKNDARFLINLTIKGPTILFFPQVNFMSAQMLAAAASKAAGASKENLNVLFVF